MGQIIFDMPNAAYHASEAISKSGLDQIARSPAHYKYSPSANDSEALILGSAFHDFVLLPDVFKKTYVVLPEDFNSKTKAGKAELAALKKAGKVILKADWMHSIDGMAASIKRHPKASKLLQNGKPEVSIFWVDSDTGLDCRCRPDFIHDSGILVDLKSTVDASPAAFSRSAAKFRYHVQDAFYSEGYKQATGSFPRGFVFVAVEKKTPFAVGCYELDDEAKALGRFLFENDLNTLLKAKTSNSWPSSYSDEIENLSLPAWAFRKGF